MIDMLAINIPLTNEAVIPLGDCGFVDYEKLAEKTGLKISSGEIEFSIVNDRKEVKTRDLYHAWSTIPSSYTDIACKVFNADPRANSFWSYVQIKASPAKVMQGHNVFGSEDFRLCAEFILDSLKQAQPELFGLLDVGLAELVRVDCTYSIKCEHADIARQVIKQLSNVSNRYIKPARNSDYESTVYFNRATKVNPNAGRSYELCVYTKDSEITHQLNELMKRAKKGNSERYNRVIEELSKPELQEFAANRLRFEGRAKKRLIEKHVGSNNLWKVIRHAEEFEALNGYSYCEWMFKAMFHDLLESFKGKELELYNDIKIKTLLRDMYTTITRKGNFSYAKADRLFRFYLSLCDRGYAEVKSNSSKATLHRNMRELMAVGISKAELQNLTMGERIPLAKILTFDFNNQRPSYYVEPISPNAHIDDTSPLMVAYGVSYRLAHEYGLSNDPLEALKEKYNLTDDNVALDLVNGKTVTMCDRTILSLVIWPDGEMVLVQKDINQI